MATLFQLPKAVPISSGNGYSGAKAYFYQSGTTTPITTYTTAALSVAHANPVVADANGVFAPIFLDEGANPTYKLRLNTSSDVLIYEVDALPASLNQQNIGATLWPRSDAEIAAGVTPANYYYEWGNVLRYGTNTAPGTTNMATALQNALNVAARSKGEVVIPGGDYLIANDITCVNTASLFYDGVIIRGESSGLNESGTELIFSSTSGTRWLFSAESNSSAFINKIQLRDLYLRIGGASPSGQLLRFRRAQNVKFTNVYLRGNNGTETLLDGAGWVSWYLEDCYFRDASVGVMSSTISGWTDFHNVIKFLSCTFDDLTTAWDFRIAGRSIELDTCTHEPAEAGGASACYDGNYNTFLRNCWFGDANGTGTWVTTAGEQFSAIDCECTSGAKAYDINNIFGCHIEGGRAEGATAAIDLGATKKGTVRNVRILIATNNGVGIDVTAGNGHVIEDNDIVESGTPTGTIGYRLAAATSGYLRDRNPGTVDTTLTNNATAGAWTISDASKRDVTVIDANATIDPASIAAGAVGTFDVTATGAEVGDGAIVIPPTGLDTGLVWCGWVQAANIVRVRIINGTAGAIDPASASWRVRVIKQTA